MCNLRERVHGVIRCARTHVGVFKLPAHFCPFVQRRTTFNSMLGKALQEGFEEGMLKGVEEGIRQAQQAHAEQQQPQQTPKMLQQHILRNHVRLLFSH